MKKIILIFWLLILIPSCKENDEYNTGGGGGGYAGPILYNCSNAVYPDWELSLYVLPYPAGSTYKVDLNNCSSSYHAPGYPDQFATDFNMPIGSIVTASRAGTVVYVEDSGDDFQTEINNLVVISHGGGIYSQYMHLTKNGALVDVGDNVNQGNILGYSGATGLAGYPHLHFVVIYGAANWEFPYNSIPVNFSNTTPNPTGLSQGEFYTAL